MQLFKTEERIGSRRVAEKEIPRHILNRKADKKLEYVAELYGAAMDKKLTEIKSLLLKKTLYCSGFRFLEYLDLRYTYENRLWAFSYNLNLRTTLDMTEKAHETEACRFVVKTGGKLSVVSAQWMDGGSKCDARSQEQYLKHLNHPFILERITAMDLTDVEAAFHPVNGRWSISAKSLIGSATWILIPPVMHLIKPKPIECVRMLELFELVADAVAGKNCPG